MSEEFKINLGGYATEKKPDDFTLKIQTGGGVPVRKVQIGNLVKESDPILRKVCIPWMFGSASGNPMPEMRMARLLIDTAKAYGALGLAAPQIGYPYRVFCIGNGDQWQICFNPSFVARTEKRPVVMRGTEGCLSFPGLSLPITRAHEIDAKFYMPDGTERNEHYVGMTARAFQHEYDHLQGVVFTDYMGEMSLLMAREKRRKLIRKLERRNKQKR